MTFDLTRVRQDTRFRRLTVDRVEHLTPLMRRIHFTSPEMEGFASPGFDDHIRLFFPAPGAPLPVPERGENGMIWPDPAPVSREYTPRAWGPDTFVVDFVIHDHGPASDWARAAKPGDQIGVGGPRGSFLVTGRPDAEVLLGDATALPAIARRLEELPEGAKAVVAVEIAGAAEEIALPTAAALDLTWLHLDRGQSLTAFVAALELPPGEIFVFCGAEAETVDTLRARLAALGHPTGKSRLSNYWRRGVADSH